MRITREWLHRHATKGRGWNRKQLQVLGVPWPPTKGWLSRAVGRELSESDRAAFESAARGTRESTAGYLPGNPRDEEHGLQAPIAAIES